MTLFNDIEGWRNRLRAAAVDFAGADGLARDRAADELEIAAHGFASAGDAVAREHEENGEVCCEICGNWVPEENAAMPPEDCFWVCQVCSELCSSDHEDLLDRFGVERTP